MNNCIEIITIIIIINNNSYYLQRISISVNSISDEQTIWANSFITLSHYSLTMHVFFNRLCLSCFMLRGRRGTQMGFRFWKNCRFKIMHLRVGKAVWLLKERERHSAVVWQTFGSDNRRIRRYPTRRRRVISANWKNRLGTSSSWSFWNIELRFELTPRSGLRTSFSIRRHSLTTHIITHRLITDGTNKSRHVMTDCWRW